MDEGDGGPAGDKEYEQDGEEKAETLNEDGGPAGDKEYEQDGEEKAETLNEDGGPAGDEVIRLKGDVDPEQRKVYQASVERMDPSPDGDDDSA